MPVRPLSSRVKRSVFEESANTNPLPVADPDPVKESLAEGVEEERPVLPFLEIVRMGMDEVAKQFPLFATQVSDEVAKEKYPPWEIKVQCLNDSAAA